MVTGTTRTRIKKTKKQVTAIGLKKKQTMTGDSSEIHRPTELFYETTREEREEKEGIDAATATSKIAKVRVCVILY